ncbi:hypothetical protein VNO80_33088 [Phaseolus coccineus]|uniref:RNA-dependent RNA polymerase n=1 Tax=Phaseolus coccineus TaxID=3886 RepID=A0AAN9Q8K3_PHACN
MPQHNKRMMPPSWGADRIGVSLGSHRPTVILKLPCLVEKKRTKVRSLAVLFSAANWDRSPARGQYIPKGALVIFDGLNKELCVGIHLVVIRIVHLGRKSGWLFCAFYLKQAASSLMMAYGGDEFVHPDNAVPVSLTRSGYPRIIPSHHRRIILKKDEKADMLVVGLVGSIKENFNRLISRYAPWIKRIPLEQGLRFEPTWKALPTHSLTKRVWVERRKLPYRKIRNFRSSFTSFSHELGAFQWLLVVGHSQGTQWKLCERLLKPIHHWFAEVLRRIPMDDQTAPLIRLVPSKTCLSYDLKSATDGWPLVFLFERLALLFDRSFASSVVNTTLGTNVFEVPFVKRALSQVSFVTGQPLGYYGYWPLFAFTHHVLVWWAAEQVRPGILFDRYAILGDDVLITDPLVAEQYRLGLQRLGVKISTHKSLISSTGAVEFAKQFLVKDMRVNLSPVSMKALCGFHHPHGYYL